jgi:hypothetical protein
MGFLIIKGIKLGFIRLNFKERVADEKELVLNLAI